MTDTMQDATTTETLPDFIEVNGFRLPTKPGAVRRNPPGAPSEEQRWFTMNYNGEWDMFWQGECVRCGRNVWREEGCPGNLSSYLSTEFIYREFEHEGKKRVACEYCFSGYGERRVKQAADGHFDVTPDKTYAFEWPEEVKAIIAQRLEQERAKQAHFLQQMPMAPAQGAVVYIPETERIERFDRWNADGQAVMQSGAVFEQEQVLTLIPALYGIMHDNVLVLGNGADGALVPITERPKDECTGTIVRWAYTGHNHGVTIKMPNGRNVTRNADHVAVMVPTVNPEKERPKQRADRLQFILDRQQYGLHARLVSEGVNRGWCETFDPILDSQGFAPRHPAKVVSGTITFTHQLKDNVDPSVIEGIERGDVTYILDYVGRASMTVSDVKVEQPPAVRLLS